MGSCDLDLDEAFSYFLVTDNSLIDLLSPFSSAITNDAHPPIYYLFSYLWVHSGYPILMLFSSSRELAFRFPFAIIGIITTYTMYRIGKQVGKKELGLFLALIHAINSFSVQVTHQARMYPLVELLSAIILLKLLSLHSAFTKKSILFLALLSGLLLMTHYASFFYLLVIWITLFYYFRKHVKSIIGALLLFVLSYVWWVPGLLNQLSREATSSMANGSTGAIIPFTMFHFLTGDRALVLGTFLPDTFHILIAFATILLIFLILLSLWKSKAQFSENFLLFLILLIPLILQWLGTFKVQRIFNGTHYAIYGLPVFLLLFSIAVRCVSRFYPRRVILIILSLIMINALTLIPFFNNSLIFSEPWHEATKSIRSFNPENIYIYPSYMSVLLRFYGPDLPIVGLSQEGNKLNTASNTVIGLSGKGTQDKNIFLLISHDRGLGQFYLKRFKEFYQERPYVHDFHNIQIYRFTFNS